jgi:hypothetical protein
MANLSDRRSVREENRFSEFLPMISEIGGQSATGAMYDPKYVDRGISRQTDRSGSDLRVDQPSAAPRSGVKLYDAEQVAADLPQWEGRELNAGRSEADRLQAQADSEDVLAHMRSQRNKGKSDSLISNAAFPENEKVPGANAFMEWLGKDNVQVGIQGLLGSLGAVFGGMAGIPAGGGDMSSMERAAVRAAAAPGQARARLQERKFIEYIDEQLKTETNMERRELLQAARANPKQAAQYLAMEGPESKQQRLLEIAKIEHEYRMEEQELVNTGRVNAAGAKGRQITPGRQDLINSADAWWRLLPSDVRAEAEAGDWISLLFDPSAIKFVPYLYSPNGGPLYTGPENINMDLSGDYTYKGKDGTKKTVNKRDMVMNAIEEQWDSLDPEGRRFFDLIMMKNKAAEDDPTLSSSGHDVAGSLGLK